MYLPSPVLNIHYFRIVRSPAVIKVCYSSHKDMRLVVAVILPM